MCSNWTITAMFVPTYRDSTWPDTVVDFDAGLNAVVRKLRIALEDDAERPRYVETIRRRGYRYVGSSPIERIGEPGTGLPSDSSPQHATASPAAGAVSRHHAVIAAALVA
jgi:DNA-binding winged helix-turn-helix (wHTH) protein